MKIIRLILGLFQWLVLIVLTVLVIYVVSSNFNILGGYRPYVVQSGSMEPSIMTGDIIVIHSKPKYEINDVITFKNAPDHIVTHRIVSIDRSEGNIYSTKGDANRTGDDDVVTDQQVIGSVVLTIPKLGYLVSTAKSKTGMIYMILVPALIFILDEIFKISKNKKNRKEALKTNDTSRD